MVRKEYLLLFAVSFVPFLFFGLLSPQVFLDADSYYFLDAICHDGEVQTNFLFQALLPLLPCNFLALKLFNFLAFFGCLMVFCRIGELFDKKQGYLLGFIVFGLTFFITDFFKFENEALGYFFGLAALYFATKCMVKHSWLDWKVLKTKEYWLAGALFLVSSLFWSGNIYWLVGTSFFSLFFAIPGFLVALVFGNQFWWFIPANNVVSEQLPFLGLIYLGLVLFLSFGVLKTPKRIVLMHVFLMVLTVLCTKLFVLAVFSASLISFFALTQFFKEKEFIEQGIIAFCVLMTIFFVIMPGNSFPTNSDISLIQEAIKIDPNISNPYGIGHIIQFWGGYPTKKGYNLDPLEPAPTLITYSKETILDLYKNIDFNDCNQANSSKNLVLWNCQKKLTKP